MSELIIENSQDIVEFTDDMIHLIQSVCDKTLELEAKVSLSFQYSLDRVTWSKILVDLSISHPRINVNNGVDIALPTSNWII